MRVGILGSGLMGGKLGTIFARAGHEVVPSRHSLKSKLGRFSGKVQAGTATSWPGGHEDIDWLIRGTV